ncbi:MDR family MFS transporter [Brevibacillus dissolubilis]|uniref:MDR family MFS transporter n=1 Tax=Brevibacillus dissolubilis TaxID=1844116 RepID=UPI0011165889|nr:MFS transporter [Brevibacillus dissolubilis]
MKWLTWDRNLQVRLFGEMLIQIFFWMFFPFMAVYFSNQYGKETAAWMLALPSVLGLFVGLLGGWLADRIGRKKTMIAGMLTQGLLFVIFWFASSAGSWWEYLAYVGMSSAYLIYLPASQAMVADLTEEAERRSVFAVFYAAMNVSIVLGPVLGAYVFEHHRLLVTLLCGLVLIGYALVIALFVKETLPVRQKQEQMKQQRENPLVAQLRSYRLIFLDKPFAVYLLASSLIAVVYMQTSLYMAVYVRENVPVQTLFSWADGTFTLGGTEVYGWMMGENGILVITCTMLVTRWFRNWSDRNALMLSACLIGTAMFAMSFTANVWMLFAFMAVFTLGELIRTPVAQSFVSKYAPADLRGQYMGASNLQFTLGKFFAPLIIGLAGTLPPVGVFGAVLVCALVSAGLFAWLFSMIARQK